MNALVNHCIANDGTLVIIFDNDTSLREALSRLFRSTGMQVRAMASAKEMLEFELSDVPSCLVLEARFPGFSGLKFQAQLNNANTHLPIVFMTRQGDMATVVRAMKTGAIEFLGKLFLEQDLLDAIACAIDVNRKHRAKIDCKSSPMEHYASLSNREQKVMGMVNSGLMNKQIADRLALSVITIKIHRTHAMRKMKAKTFADLVRMAEALTRDN